jgi:hypothetical protein
MPTLMELVDPEQHPEFYEKLMDMISKSDPSIKGAILSGWYNSEQEALQAMDLLVSLSDMLADFDVETMEENLETYLSVAAGEGAPRRHLGMIGKYVGEFKEPEKRREQIELICEFLAKLAINEANPERHLRIKQLIEAAIDKSAKEEKVDTVSKMSTFGMEFTFKFNASEVMSLITSIMNKELIVQKDLERIMDIIYPDALTGRIKTALYDVIEDIFLTDVKEDSYDRLGIAHKLAAAATHIDTSFTAFINAMASRPKLFEGIKGTLRQLQKQALLDIADEINMTIEQIEAGDALIVKIQTEMEEVLHLSDAILQRLNYSMKSFGLSKVDIGGEFYFQMQDISLMLRSMANELEIFLSRLIGRHSTQLLSGQLSGGLLFERARSAIQIAQIHVIDFIKSYEIFVERRDKYVSIKKKKESFEETFDKNKDRIRPDNIYSFSQMIKPNYSSYLFSVSKDFVDDLRILGFERGVAEDIAASISDKIYNRQGLDNEIMEYMETAILTNLGIL